MRTMLYRCWARVAQSEITAVLVALAMLHGGAQLYMMVFLIGYTTFGWVGAVAESTSYCAMVLVALRMLRQLRVAVAQGEVAVQQEATDGEL